MCFVFLVWCFVLFGICSFFSFCLFMVLCIFYLLLFYICLAFVVSRFSFSVFCCCFFGFRFFVLFFQGLLGVKFQPRAPTPGKPQKSAPVRTLLQNKTGRLPKSQNQKLGNGAFSASHCRSMTTHEFVCSSFGPNLEREGFRAVGHFCTPVRTQLPTIVFWGGKDSGTFRKASFRFGSLPSFWRSVPHGKRHFGPKKWEGFRGARRVL